VEHPIQHCGPVIYCVLIKNELNFYGLYENSDYRSSGFMERVHGCFLNSRSLCLVEVAVYVIDSSCITEEARYKAHE
jgi:hypothetical protein